MDQAGKIVSEVLCFINITLVIMYTAKKSGYYQKIYKKKIFSSDWRAPEKINFKHAWTDNFKTDVHHLRTCTNMFQFKKMLKKNNNQNL